MLKTIHIKGYGVVQLRSIVFISEPVGIYGVYKIHLNSGKVIQTENKDLLHRFLVKQWEKIL